MNLALYLIPLILNTITYKKLNEWLIYRFFAEKTSKKEEFIDFNSKKFNVCDLIDVLGIKNKGKSPLEKHEIFKELLKKNSIDITENAIRKIILCFLKVFFLLEKSSFFFDSVVQR